jgi:hypothetical protein
MGRSGVLFSKHKGLVEGDVLGMNSDGGYRAP